MRTEGHEALLNYIDGEWVPSEGGRTISNLNPADTRVPLGLVVDGSGADARRAIDSAARAFVTWRKTPAPKRGDYLLEAMRLMATRRDALARALTLEEGKTLSDSLGEVSKSILLLEYIAGESLRLNGQTIPSEMSRTFAYTVRAPLGVCGLITPWNFPVAIPVWKIAPALVAGNTVVLKPSPFTPWTAQLIVQIFADAGLPPGVLNLVHGAAQPGEVLLSHPDVRALSFTGSTKTGTHVYETGARHLKKVQCEMGGKNPVIVLGDADLELAAASTVMGAFGSTGQRCTATSRAIVMKEVADDLVARIEAKARALTIGNGMSPGVDVGPSVNKDQLEKVLHYHGIAKTEGLKLVCGGSRREEGELAHGYFSAPTIYDHVPPDSRLAKEEIFGPVLSVIRVSSFKEAFEVSNDVAYGLSSSVFTNDVTRVMEYVDEVETGILHVNSPTIGGEAQLPFGGMKSTGVGQREMGPTAVDFFSDWKTVYIDYTGARRESKIY
ncbi:MAG: aldehyde dehydrogenase family protein [Deltaproteobacteria bacterium]|nr:aldehyde dehydrogenase family protein [Deltaproteobacteria bacterium]